MNLDPPFSFALLGPHAETALTVAPGATFSVQAWIFVPLADTAGVDWRFGLPPGFAVISREGGWPYNDYLASDPTAAQAAQGAVLDNVAVAQGPGLYDLGRYLVGAPQAPGYYIVSGEFQNGTGVIGGPPDFIEAAFTQTAALSVTVTPPPAIPEASVLWLVAAAAFVLLRKKIASARC